MVLAGRCINRVISSHPSRSKAEEKYIARMEKEVILARIPTLPDVISAQVPKLIMGISVVRSSFTYRNLDTAWFC